MQMTETKTRTFELTADDVRKACIAYVASETRGAHKRSEKVQVTFNLVEDGGDAQVTGATLTFPIAGKGQSQPAVVDDCGEDPHCDRTGFDGK